MTCWDCEFIDVGDTGDYGVGGAYGSCTNKGSARYGIGDFEMTSRENPPCELFVKTKFMKYNRALREMLQDNHERVKRSLDWLK